MLIQVKAFEQANVCIFLSFIASCVHPVRSFLFRISKIIGPRISITFYDGSKYFDVNRWSLSWSESEQLQKKRLRREFGITSNQNVFAQFNGTWDKQFIFRHLCEPTFSFNVKYFADNEVGVLFLLKLSYVIGNQLALLMTWVISALFLPYVCYINYVSVSKKISGSVQQVHTAMNHQV